MLSRSSVALEAGPYAGSRLGWYFDVYVSFGSWCDKLGSAAVPGGEEVRRFVGRLRGFGSERAVVNSAVKRGRE